MSSTQLLASLRPFWRVPVLAILAGALAFAGSYLVSSSYESTVPLLVRGRDATFLTNTGQSLADQPGVIDSTLAQALGATQSALGSSRRVAEMVVEDLGLDQPRPKDTSLMGNIRSVFKEFFSSIKAFLIYGFNPTPDPRQAAIDAVHSGLSARPLEASYVVELTATAESPQLAAAIADSAATALVAVSLERFHEEAATYRDFLAGQVERAESEEAAAAEAVRAFMEANEITDVGLEIELSTRSAEELRRDLEQTKVNLQSTVAELAAINDSLDEVSSRESSTSRIRTGRSTTQIDATGSSTAFQELLVVRETLEGRVAALEARQNGLEEALSGGSEPLTDQQSDLQQLEVRHSAASETYRLLNEQYQQAILTAASDRVEITPVDNAPTPVFPASPKRYLYLAMGAIAGAMAGLVLTYLSGWRPSLSLVATREALPEPVILAAGRTRIGRFELFSADGESIERDSEVSA